MDMRSIVGANQHDPNEISASVDNSREAVAPSAVEAQLTHEETFRGETKTTKKVSTRNSNFFAV